MKLGKTVNSFLKDFGIAKILSPLYIEYQKEAAKILKDTFELIKNNLNMDLFELDKLAENNILKLGGSPVFKGYRGFPNTLCMSINNCLLHGIPKNNILNQNDKITFDFGVEYKGSMVDSARTFIIGENKILSQMIENADNSLIEIEKNVAPEDRSGKVGYIIYRNANRRGFNVLESHGGHGIADKIHDFPFYSNRGDINEGCRILPGMSLAIEPILIQIGSSKQVIKDKEDGWSLYSEKIGIHQEDTFIMTGNGLVNLTR